jgi:hypothetical protein
MRLLRLRSALLSVALLPVAALAGCDDRSGDGIGSVFAQLGGSGLRDEMRSLRIVAFDLVTQGCTGSRVDRPALPPVATTGLVRPDVLQVTLSIPAGPRTLYAEVYRDVDGIERFGTGCAELVLAPGESRTVRIAIETAAADADADADGDGDGDVADDAELPDGADDAADTPADVDAPDAPDDGPETLDEAETLDDAADADEVDTAGNPQLVISEVDHQQDGTDSMEFVELYNWGPVAVPCAGLELYLVSQSGGSSTVYATQPLACTEIAAGEFYVVGSDALLTSISSFCRGTERLRGGGTDLLQNGNSSSEGDGVVLIRRVDPVAVPVDQLVYWGPVSGWGEGSPAPVDRSSAESLQRRPAGADTGNNASDFLRLAPTPCAPPP